MRLPGSSLVSGFRFPVSNFGLVHLRSLLNFPFLVSIQALARAIVQLQGGSRFPVSDSGLDLLRSLLNFVSPFSSRALVRLPGSRPDSSLWFQNLVWTCSARFSIFGVRFQAGLSCNCSAPVRFQIAAFSASSFRFQFGPAPVAAHFAVSDFQLVSRAIARLHPGFWFLVSGFVGSKCEFSYVVWKVPARKHCYSLQGPSNL